MKVFLAFMAVLALALLLLMHSIRGLRTEKVFREGASWQEVHLVWDWNKMIAWEEEHHLFQKIEREQKEKTETDTENTTK